MNNIVNSSPAALALMKAREETGEVMRSQYPFHELEPGQSFTYSMEAINWQSLRVLMYKQNKKLAGVKEFAFIKHDDLGVVEVARIV